MYFKMSTKHSQNLRKIVQEFLMEIINIEPDDGFFTAQCYIANESTDAVLMAEFIRIVYPHRQEIKRRNEDFFLENDGIFDVFSSPQESEKNHMNHVNRLRNLWQSPKIEKEDKEVIWEYFDSFLSLARKHQQEIEQS